ncbi:hypothetical protein Tco_0008507 [Tanacetum coccineum]
MPYDSPLHDVHSHGSAKGSVQQHDLTVLVTKLNDQINGLEKDLQQTKKTYSTALTKLELRVKKLEYKLKSGKTKRKAKIEEEVHEKLSDETEVLVQEETPTKIIKEHGSGEKGEMEISTANIQVSTASPLKVSTAVPYVYTRRSAKDKGKAIMEEPATLKKVKKRTQVQLSMDEELARKMEEEERIRFNVEQEARALQDEEVERLNLEAARELQRQLDQRQEVEKDSSKPSEKETSKIVEEEKVEEEDVNPEPVLIEKKGVGIRRKTLAKRRASDKQGQDNSKRQKKEKETADYEEEKDELRMWLTVVPDEEEFVDPEILHTKFPIVDWESQSLGNMHVYKIIRADRNTSYHKTFESMLKSFDRHDLEILVDPEQDDDIWKNQNQWKITSWKLYETCGVHILMVDGTLMTIHMFVEKKYPFTKETLQKMLNWKLEAEAESFMAFELLSLSSLILKNNKSMFERILSKRRIEDLIQKKLEI